MTSRTLLTVLLLLVPTAGLAAPIKVVASFSVLGDIVRQIAGDHAVVVTLVGPDGDAHTFDPSPADAKKLADAALVVSNGLGLDGWIERLAKSSDYKGTIVVASQNIPARRMTEEEGGTKKEVTDPHAWQNLRNGAIYVRNIEAALEKADPANATAYKQAAEKYTGELLALDAEVRTQIAAVPKAKRRVITSHDAFGYFGAAYGVEFLAPEGISTETEPSAGDVAKLVDQIRAEHIKALFIENMTDARLVTIIGDETGAIVGGTLFSDALSPPDGPAPTYIAMFKNNVPKLIEGMARN